MSSIASGTQGGGNVWLRYNQLNHHPWSLHLNVSVTVATRAVARVFLVAIADQDLAIEMDKWLVELIPGLNTIMRQGTEAPHLSRRPGQSLQALQRLLLMGQISPAAFNWGGCGWPPSLNVPRGSPSGMTWRLVVVVSPLLAFDTGRLGEWEQARRQSWTYCGVTQGQFPDNRPLAFPMDRPTTRATIQQLSDTYPNIFIRNISIFHRPSATIYPSPTSPTPTPTNPTPQQQPSTLFNPRPLMNRQQAPPRPLPARPVPSQTQWRRQWQQPPRPQQPQFWWRRG